MPLVPPPLAPGVLPEVTRADFERYRRSYAAKFQRFEGVRRANEAFRAAASDLAPGGCRRASRAWFTQSGKCSDAQLPIALSLLPCATNRGYAHGMAMCAVVGAICDHLPGKWKGADVCER